MKARYCLLVPLLSLPILLNCQSDIDYGVIKQRVKSTPIQVEKQLAELTKHLTSPFESEYEKAYSIYLWITSSIEYDHKAVGDKTKRINKSNEDILRRKKAICQGYSILFRDMGNLANLKSFVISGYSKGTPTSKPEMSAPDHAWNVVQLDGNWHLLDATWAPSLSTEQNTFVIPPHQFILDHLPSDPKWQLLDCPISTELFQKSPDEIKTFLQKRDSCFNYKEAIAKFLAKTPHEQKMEEALNSYQFNPSQKNKSELGHTYMDYAGVLSDQLDQLNVESDLAEIISIQKEIIEACQKAAELTTLFNWQVELHTQVLINQAVALSRSPKGTTTEVVSHLKQAQKLLLQLPESLFTTQAKAQCDAYLAAFESN